MKSIHNSEFIIHNSQQGQVLIAALLILLVTSVIVLAVASRSITNVRISETSEESSRAFSAAEAGVEEAVEKIRANPNLTSDNPPPQQLPNNATYDYEISQQGGSTKAFLSPTQLASDLQTLQVYLAEKDTWTNPYSASDLCLLWGDRGGAEAPAIEATIIQQSGATLTNTRFAIDSTSRGNSFILANNDPSCTKQVLAVNNNLGVDREFLYTHRLSLASIAPADRRLLRLRLLYNRTSPQYVGVLPLAGINLPAQGYKISSTGTTTGGTTRKVEVFSSFPTLPAIFDFVLYNGSGNAVTK